ncbi:LacI family DNA-binding transcriptional regulator [Culicoidibacter larvae]|uniref:LacI family transcriptional regulator n=1 Tax=Culicoidibacter larvae TaxID=2579976 RepID=A0A5R8QBM7_9FIRM|nr:LacI family DNA-binding transcriptional regulator [Culicoidibacter larvae]TLG73935.1 LacI family transcriptional regulator [Culicoidibacter larvae]
MKIDDIARIAKVSKSAVSLALNGKPGVSDKTRAHILKIAEEYNYIPLRNNKKKDTSGQQIIRFLACKNNDIITDHYETLPFFNELIGYLTEDIKEYPFTLLISTINADDMQNELTELEIAQPSAGILLLGTNLSSNQVQIVKDIQPNLVVLDTCIRNMPVSFVSINNYFGGFEAARYLLSLGHTKIGYVMGQPRIYNFDYRQKGFNDALNEAGITIDKQHIYHLPAMQIGIYEQAKNQIQATTDLPTAIFCENDYMAISIIKILADIGISVPDDVSIIGFDNISEGNVVTPELTTIHVKKNLLSAMSLQQLSQQIETKHPNDSYQILINTSLIERNSCKTLK